MRSVLLASLVLLAAAARGEPTPQAAMRNQSLANIPDNTWVQLNARMPNRNGGARSSGPTTP